MNELITIQSTEHYQQLVEDCKSILIEKIFRAKMEVIEAKWEVGQRISTDNKFEEYSTESGDFIKQLAKDLKVSRSDLYDSVKFYKMFPDGVSTAIDSLGKNLSWTKLRVKYLGKRATKEPEVRYTIEEVENAYHTYIADSAKTFEEFKIILESVERPKLRR